jgi:hypothetical protein
MLFLVRNLATNCTGLHRDYARRVFAEVRYCLSHERIL